MVVLDRACNDGCWTSFHVIQRAPFPEYTSIYGSEFGFAPNVRVLRASAVQDTGISDSKC